MLTRPRDAVGFPSANHRGDEHRRWLMATHNQSQTRSFWLCHSSSYLATHHSVCVRLSVFLSCYRASFLLTRSFLSQLQILHEFIRLALMSRFSCGGKKKKSGLKVLRLFTLHELLMHKRNSSVNPLLIIHFILSFWLKKQQQKTNLKQKRLQWY